MRAQTKNRLGLFKRIKEYIVSKFLPAYAKEIYSELKEENLLLKQQIREQQAYIRGLEYATNKRTKIINNINGGDEK